MVTDTGIGIPRERQKAIFEPFVQADISTTRRFGGTGLGVNIAKELVELMGGRLELESDPEIGGSEFRFVINMDQVESLPEDASRDYTCDDNLFASKTLPGKILLVEDYPGQRDGCSGIS